MRIMVFRPFDNMAHIETTKEKYRFDACKGYITEGFGTVEFVRFKDNEDGTIIWIAINEDGKMLQLPMSLILPLQDNSYDVLVGTCVFVKTDPITDWLETEHEDYEVVNMNKDDIEFIKEFTSGKKQAELTIQTGASKKALVGFDDLIGALLKAGVKEKDLPECLARINEQVTPVMQKAAQSGKMNDTEVAILALEEIEKVVKELIKEKKLGDRRK